MTEPVAARELEFSESRVGKVLSKIAGFLADQADPGAVAALRRMDVDVPTPPIFWWIYFRFVQATDETRFSSHHVRRWARLIQLMAWLGGLHDPKLPLGEALARAGLSELRFERFLRIDPDVHYDLVRRVALYLRSAHQASNQVDWAMVLMKRPGRSREEFLLRTARDYYRHVAASQRNT